MQVGIPEVEHIESFDVNGATASLGLVFNHPWLYDLKGNGNAEDGLQCIKQVQNRAKELGYDSLCTDTARWDVAETALGLGFEMKSMIMEKKL